MSPGQTSARSSALHNFGLEFSSFAEGSDTLGEIVQEIHIPDSTVPALYLPAESPSPKSGCIDGISRKTP